MLAIASRVVSRARPLLAQRCAWLSASASTVVAVPPLRDGSRLGAPLPGLRVLFCGTDTVSTATLRELAAARDAGHIRSLDVLCPGPRKRRGGRLEVTAVEEEAIALGLEPVRLPEGRRPLQAVSNGALAGATFDVGVVVSFGYMLPDALLDLCTAGAINVHPSALPRLRGAAPVVHTLLGTDEEKPLLPAEQAASACGVTVLRVSRELDAGDVLAQELHRPTPTDDVASLTERLAARGGQLTAECLLKLQEDMAAGRPAWDWAVPQSTLSVQSGCLGDPGFTVAPKVSQANGRLDWDDEQFASAVGLTRAVRALGALGIGVRGRLDSKDSDTCTGPSDARWGAGLALGRRVHGAELKLVAAAVAGNQSELPLELSDAHGQPTGTLAVTGPKKAPRLWLRCADAWAEVLEAQISGRGRMIIPELVRALGTRSARGPAAVLSTMPADS